VLGGARPCLGGSARVKSGSREEVDAGRSLER